MSSRVYATGRIKDPLPLIEKSRASRPGGRLPFSLTHQVIMITGLSCRPIRLYVLALKMAPDADRALNHHSNKQHKWASLYSGTNYAPKVMSLPSPFSTFLSQTTRVEA